MSERSDLARINRLFIEALMLLREHGATDEACRLAGRAWSAIRRSDPREAERINGAMHALATDPGLFINTFNNPRSQS